MTKGQTIIEDVARLLSDGRERTGADISAQLRIKPQQVPYPLSRLKKMGLVKSDRVDGAVIWRSTV